MRVSPPNASVKDALFAVLVFNAPYLSFRAEQADAFSFAFAPANVSACAVEESLLSCAFLDWPHSDDRSWNSTHVACTLNSMDFSLTDHQKLIRDTVRQFMDTEVRPVVKDLEREEKFPLDLLKKLGEMGCCGMLTPEEWGGPGMDTVSYVMMLEEVARVYTAMSTALGVTNSAVQAPLVMFGNEAQKRKYLRRMATGETLGAFCLTEPAAGSDAAGIQARAVRDGNVYKLNGTKTWVTNGNVAGVYVVFAKTDPAAGGKGVSAFLVEPDLPGFRRGRHEEKMGQHSSPSVEIL